MPFHMIYFDHQRNSPVLTKSINAHYKKKRFKIMETGRKLKFTEKLSYGLADFPEAVNSILAAFLTMFYTDNIGMARA